MIFAWISGFFGGITVSGIIFKIIYTYKTSSIVKMNKKAETAWEGNTQLYNIVMGDLQFDAMNPVFEHNTIRLTTNRTTTAQSGFYWDKTLPLYIYPYKFPEEGIVIQKSSVPIKQIKLIPIVKTFMQNF